MLLKGNNIKQINTNKKRKGFSILAVILVILAVIVAIGVLALSGQTNTSNYSNITFNPGVPITPSAPNI